MITASASFAVMIFLCLENKSLVFSGQQEEKWRNERQVWFLQLNSCKHEKEGEHTSRNQMMVRDKRRTKRKSLSLSSHQLNLSPLTLLLLFFSRWSGGKIHFSSLLLLFFEKNVTHTLSIHHPFSGQEVRLEDGGGDKNQKEEQTHPFSIMHL